MILRWDSGSTERETCPSTTLSTTCLTWTNLGPDLGRHGERPVTNYPSHGTAVRGTTNVLDKNLNILLNPTENTTISITKTTYLRLLT